jgi:hypothetical protein
VTVRFGTDSGGAKRTKFAFHVLFFVFSLEKVQKFFSQLGREYSLKGKSSKLTHFGGVVCNVLVLNGTVFCSITTPNGSCNDGRHYYQEDCDQYSITEGKPRW